MAKGIVWSEERSSVQSQDESKTVCKVSLKHVSIFLVEHDIAKYPSDVKINQAHLHAEDVPSATKENSDFGKILQINNI